METTIKVHNIRKNFGDVIALKGISFDVKPAEMFGLVGPDGAGKTTTIKLLCGLLQPTGGSAELFGFDLVKDKAKIQKHIGYLSQKFSLYGDLTIDENIEFFANLHGVKDYKNRRNELLEFTRLTPFRTRLGDNLSGGMKQKLALACTLIHKPNAIFLDEPKQGLTLFQEEISGKYFQIFSRTALLFLCQLPILMKLSAATGLLFLIRAKY